MIDLVVRGFMDTYLNDVDYKIFMYDPSISTQEVEITTVDEDMLIRHFVIRVIDNVGFMLYNDHKVALISITFDYDRHLFKMHVFVSEEYYEYVMEIIESLAMANAIIEIYQNESCVCNCGRY